MGWKREGKGDEPSTTARKPSTFIPRLRNQSSNPGLNICRVMHIIIVSENLGILYQDVDNARVL